MLFTSTDEEVGAILEKYREYANDFEYKIPNRIFFWITTNESAMNPKIIKRIDQKIDDGSYNGGNFRFKCNNKHYDYAIENKIECSEGMVKLIDI